MELAKMPFSSGGEALIYNLEDDPTLVAKIHTGGNSAAKHELIAARPVADSEHFVVPKKMEIVSVPGSNKELIALVMPKAKYSLQDKLDREGPSLGLAKEVMADLIPAMKEMESKGLCHGDIKPANILNHNGKWKLSDVSGMKSVKSRSNDDTLFTLEYAEPETIVGKNPAKNTDIYAFAVTIGKTASGYETGRDHTKMNNSYAIKPFNTVDRDLNDLLSYMVEDRVYRPCATEVSSLSRKIAFLPSQSPAPQHHQSTSRGH